MLRGLVRFPERPYIILRTNVKVKRQGIIIHFARWGEWARWSPRLHLNPLVPGQLIGPLTLCVQSLHPIVKSHGPSERTMHRGRSRPVKHLAKWPWEVWKEVPGYPSLHWVGVH